MTPANRNSFKTKHRLKWIGSNSICKKKKFQGSLKVSLCGTGRQTDFYMDIKSLKIWMIYNKGNLKAELLFKGEENILRNVNIV